MKKGRFKVILNWQGQVFETYHLVKDENQALRNAIRKLADEVGYTNVYVRNHILNGNRYEVRRR